MKTTSNITLRKTVIYRENWGDVYFYVDDASNIWDIDKKIIIGYYFCKDRDGSNEDLRLNACFGQCLTECVCKSLSNRSKYKRTNEHLCGLYPCKECGEYQPYFMATLHVKYCLMCHNEHSFRDDYFEKKNCTICGNDNSLKRGWDAGVFCEHVFCKKCLVYVTSSQKQNFNLCVLENAHTNEENHYSDLGKKKKGISCSSVNKNDPDIVTIYFESHSDNPPSLPLIEKHECKMNDVDPTELDIIYNNLKNVFKKTNVDIQNEDPPDNDFFSGDDYSTSSDDDFTNSEYEYNSEERKHFKASFDRNEFKSCPIRYCTYKNYLCLKFLNFDENSKIYSGDEINHTWERISCKSIWNKELHKYLNDDSRSEINEIIKIQQLRPTNFKISKDIMYSSLFPYLSIYHKQCNKCYHDREILDTEGKCKICAFDLKII